MRYGSGWLIWFWRLFVGQPTPLSSAHAEAITLVRPRIDAAVAVTPLEAIALARPAITAAVAIRTTIEAISIRKPSIEAAGGL